MNKEFPISDVAIDDIPLTDALVLRRQDNRITAPVVMTNVPHLVIVYSRGGFEFGYDGKGPHDLALNICEWYLMQIGYQGERINHWEGIDCEKGDCFSLSFALHKDFTRDFIENAPRDGITIPFAVLKHWFDSHL